MAIYTCNICGVAACEIHYSRDEEEPAKVIHTANCPLHSDLVPDFGLEEADQYHLETNGYPVRYDDEHGFNQCSVIMGQCPTPEADCLDCVLFEKAVGPYTVGKMKAIRNGTNKDIPGCIRHDAEDDGDDIEDTEEPEIGMEEPLLSEPTKIDGVWHCPLTSDELCEFPELAEATACEDCDVVKSYGPADDFSAADHAMWLEEHDEEP